MKGLNMKHIHLFFIDIKSKVFKQEAIQATNKANLYRVINKVSFIPYYEAMAISKNEYANHLITLTKGSNYEN